MSRYSVVGKRLPRVDALHKVTGAAVFSGDVILHHMLHGKVLRSPYPHAAIRRLDVTKALALDGVLAVITASDVPGYKRQNELSFAELPHLAKDKVVYAQQPVAVVAAPRWGSRKRPWTSSRWTTRNCPRCSIPWRPCNPRHH